MTETDKILARKDGAAGTLTFNNPEKRNAMSLDMWLRTADVLEAFRQDSDVRVVVLTGAGGKAFVSGADISRFGDERASEAAAARYGEAVERACLAIETFPKPTVAMIRGYCIGGGIALAICCDLRIASEGSRFGIPAAQLGLGYGYAGVKRLVDLVGPSFAKEIVLTARHFTVAEAQAMGLINRAVPDAELETFVSDYARAISENAPLTMQAAKLAVAEALKDERERNMAAVEDLVRQCIASADYEEGRKAFLEKRKPVFRGR